MVYKVFAPGLISTVDLDTVLQSQTIIRCTSTTRPTYPDEGWHIYETDTRRLMIFTNSQWVVDFGAEDELFAFRTADQASSGTTLINDSQLLLPMAISTVYMFEMIVFVSATGNGAYLDPELFVPSGTTIKWTPNSPETGEEGNIRRITLNSPADGYSDWVSTSGTTCFYKGVIRTGLTAGNIQFGWQSSNASFTLTLKANSFMRLRRIKSV